MLWIDMHCMTQGTCWIVDCEPTFAVSVEDIQGCDEELMSILLLISSQVTGMSPHQMEETEGDVRWPMTWVELKMKDVSVWERQHCSSALNKRRQIPPGRAVTSRTPNRSCSAFRTYVGQRGRSRAAVAYASVPAQCSSWSMCYPGLSNLAGLEGKDRRSIEQKL